MKNPLIKLLQFCVFVLLITIAAVFLAAPASISAQAATIPPPPMPPVTDAPRSPLQTTTNARIFLNMTLDFLGQGPYSSLINLQPVHSYRTASACIYPAGTDTSQYQNSDFNCNQGRGKSITLVWSPTVGGATTSLTFRSYNSSGDELDPAIGGASYKICIKVPTYLRECQDNVAIAAGQLTNFSMELHYPGDTSSDNMINAGDYGSFYTCFGKTPSTPSCNYLGADLNDDDHNDSLAAGDIKDFRIYLYGFGRSGQ